MILTKNVSITFESIVQQNILTKCCMNTDFVTFVVICGFLDKTVETTFNAFSVKRTYGKL